MKYQLLVQTLEEQIRSGLYPPHEKLPSIRLLQARTGFSANTIQTSLSELESKGMIRAHERKGYFVLPVKKSSEVFPVEVRVEGGLATRDSDAMRRLFERADSVLDTLSSRSLISFTEAMPGEAMLPVNALARLFRKHSHSATALTASGGLLELRKTLAKHFSTVKTALQPEDIVVTNGATEAIHLALRSVCSPGDVVFLEDPCYFEYYRMLDFQNLRVVTVPTDLVTGLRISELERLVNTHKPKAIVVQPHAQNPTGSSMPEASRKKLLELAREHDFYIVHDDTFAELSFLPELSSKLADLDEDNRVFWISTFSKTLGQGLRLGWVHNAKFIKDLIRLKSALNLRTASISQSVLHEFLISRAYSVHKNRLRKQIIENLNTMVEFLKAALGEKIEFTIPVGGYVLWCRFPEGFDCDALFINCLNRGVGILPGSFLSSSPEAKRHIRISYGRPLDHNALRGLRVFIDEANLRL